MVGRNNADLSFMPAKDAHKQWKNLGRIQDFLKEKQWAADSCTGRERGDINPPMGARRKGGQPKKTPHRDKKSPLHRDKSSKKAPA